MGISRSSILPLIVISSLLAGNEWLPVRDVCPSKYSAPIILAHASDERKTVNEIKVEDSLYGEYTEEEIDMMTAICYREARGEGIEGMRLVADVILNRVDSGNFPNTIKEVIAEPRQFSTYDEDDMTEDLTIDCYGAVLAELDQRTDPDILYFTAGGYNACGDPAYRVGNHYFSR